MTMDVHTNKSSKMTDEQQQPYNNNNNGHRASSKRSFDVAFLMMPDERLKQRRLQQQQQQLNTEPDDLSYRSNNNNSSPELDIDVGTEASIAARPLLRVVHESPYRHKVFDDPSLLPQAPMSNRYDHPRSAFTKVHQHNTTPAPVPSPGHSESPDNLSYQSSMSPPSPPASSTITHLFSKSPPFKSFLQSHQAAFFKAHHTYQEQQQQQQHRSPPPSDSKLPHHLLPFRPDIPHYLQRGDFPTSPYAFANFPHHGDFLKFPQQQHQQQQQQQQQQGEGNQVATINPLMRNPAAAILSTLLPPTLATLSLPGQNVCAKCNISFRMTSDLVYHMRSHHKSEVNYDAARRKREDKLKCPVCAESFRERHHLTRHMTAHQDKEGDILDHQQLDPGTETIYTPKSKSKSYYSNGLHHK